MVKEKNREIEVSSVIGKDLKIKGDISGENGIKIDGDIVGNIIGKSLISITTTGKVEGNIDCNNCIIAGIVNGGINSKGTLEIKKSAKISGDIKAVTLIVEPGASLNGNCTMGQNAIK